MTSLDSFRLVVFRKVAEQLSFRKAAEDLYLTQPAVSQQIKALEDELGALLFDRSGTHVELTQSGSILLKFAKQSSDILLKAKHEIGKLNGSYAGELTLGASTTIAQYILPRLLGDFCKEHPRVGPTLVSGNTEEIVNAVEQQKVMLGFIEGPPKSRDVRTSPFLQDELVLIVPSPHAFAERLHIPVRELAALQILMRERGSGTRQIVETALAKKGIKRNSLQIVMELDSTEAIKSAVEAGLGAGFVSRWAIAKDSRLGKAFKIVEIDDLRLFRQLSIVSPKAPQVEGLAKEFTGFVLERFGFSARQARPNSDTDK